MGLNFHELRVFAFIVRIIHYTPVFGRRTVPSEGYTKEVMMKFQAILCAVYVVRTYPTSFGCFRSYHSMFLFIVCVDTHHR